MDDCRLRPPPNIGVSLFTIIGKREMMIGVSDVESGAIDEKTISVLIESSCRSALRVAVSDKATLYAQGEPASALFLVLDGFVKTSHICEDGTEIDRKSTRLNSSHIQKSRMPSSA